MASSEDQQQNHLPLLLADEDDSSVSASDSDEEEQEEHFRFTDDFSTPTNPNPNPNPNPTPHPLRRNPGGLFQRLWTDDDEIVILEGFLDFVTERGTTHANYQHDTGPFYERIRGRIPLDFNKSQLVEKLRRLKKKYRTLAARIDSCGGSSFAFRTPHERRVYDIARNIWSTALKRPRGARHGNGNGGGAEEERRVRRRARRDGRVEVPVVLEEECRSAAAAAAPVVPSVSSVVEATVRCCLSPLFKELVMYGADGASGGVCLGSSKIFAEDERWKEQQILELEVYLKRMELLEEHIRSALDELRSTTTAAGLESAGLESETVVAS